VNGSTPFLTRNRAELLDLGFLNVTMRSIEAPNGDVFDRIVIEHPGAVAVVPVIGDEVVFIRQYRPAVDDRILEIPAGKLDVVGEDPLKAARRELAEETGFLADSFVHLTDLLTSVGFCDETISIYLADSIEAGERAPIGPEEEDAEVLRIPFDEALGLIGSGDIADAKTVVGLLLAAQIRAAS
jgi:8-oxo-dGTP pyrophosphatase MutT (NUDIX family)